MRHAIQRFASRNVLTGPGGRSAKEMDRRLPPYHGHDTHLPWTRHSRLPKPHNPNRPSIQTAIPPRQTAQPCTMTFVISPRQHPHPHSGSSSMKLTEHTGDSDEAIDEECRTMRVAVIIRAVTCADGVSKSLQLIAFCTLGMGRMAWVSLWPFKNAHSMWEFPSCLYFALKISVTANLNITFITEALQERETYHTKWSY